ncbi:uncharacterized protein LOC114789725 [Denticeps clupeoides]|uniref:Short myomegalin-like EB1 binding protein N-terminal domain-containing protein n=1 Tax=Denticeps clupeoides TaxID=299321 RepID=A0AAY4E674_9TELE|nr:uncharacterized protein LOC114789725 [Denticeps clupeoides]XP_028834874.1 uncharacterized protein LOC114789725 [Denticeps clupeoides]XP_028834875.1 uncharacterized protein LOC114789725 [Denticeps clupeoides]
MSSRGKSEGCRVCGGDLQGNQRRWLFGGQNRRGGQPQTPTKPLSTLAGSNLSSPWGSSLSLGSTLSLSKSQSTLSPSKGTDLLSILTHTVGQTVPRGNGRAEFVCGKCASLLERVFKFDTVIARVKMLSSERLRKLSQERDKIQQWVRNAYRLRHPSDYRLKRRSSEDEGGAGVAGEGYTEMLRDNMALSEFECWTEKAKSCPYFHRTGKRCKRGKSCEGCESLRVSDSDYESVCGVPRHLPGQPFSPLALSRDKSRSMPLHWSKASSVQSSPASLAGSCLSLQCPSHTNSVQSLDSLDGNDPFDWPEAELSAELGVLLKELKGIEGKPVCSPVGSRIPVLGRRPGQNGDGSPGMAPVRELHFGDPGVVGEEEADGERQDVLTELRDEFLPLHREITTGRVHTAVRQVRDQLDQAQSRIRSLEAQLNNGTTAAARPHPPGTSPKTGSINENELMESMSCLLHSRERLIRECVELMKKLWVEVGGGSADAEKLKVTLIKTLKDTERVLETSLSDLRKREQGLEREMEALRRTGQDRERDLNNLNVVLLSNQDIINELRMELGAREHMQKELQRDQEVWGERERALTAALQEKQTLTLRLKEALASSRGDVQALSDSVIGKGVAGCGAEAALARQLTEKDAVLTSCLRDKEEQGDAMWQEVNRLAAALNDAQATLQDQRVRHQEAISTLSEQLRETRRELRDKGKAIKDAEGTWTGERVERDRVERKLRESLEKRDKLMEQILLDSEGRDQMLTELQQNILSKLEPRTALKHTL